MARQDNKPSTFGCLFVVAAVVGLLVLFESFGDGTSEDRTYIAPLSSQEELDQFAMAQLDALQSKSFADEVEYCGMIYEDSEGKLSSSKVFRGDDATCDFEFEWGDALNPVASFHTHGGHNVDYDNEAPSLVDMEEDINNQVDGYIATPGGRLWRVDWREKRADLVCGERCVKQDPDYQPCRAYPVDNSYTMESLDTRIDNDPEHC